METPAVEVRDVWFSYDGHPVLRDVNLTVARQELVCVIGPNGGGKTTLLKLMLGLLTPSRGQVRILGKTPEKARPLVGYAAQYPHYDLKFPLSVMDVVLMGRLGRPGSAQSARREDRARVHAAMQEVGVYDLRRRPFGRLSAGQRQRAVIARALVAEPQLLLLDEPTAGLDIGVEADFYDLLGRLGRRLAVVLVSHDVGFVSQFAGKVVCVRETVAVHPTAELTGDLIQELYEHDIRLVRHDHDCLRQCPPGDEP